MTANLTEVAVYRRRIHASLERVWENVLDWEHLPWLHSSSFWSVELLEGRRDGWRAVAGIGDRASGLVAEIDLTGDRQRNRYLTATSSGPGAGTEIWTQLEPTGTRETDIEVRFLVPEVPVEKADLFGRFYRDLYARLWDEDERMMRHRQSMLDRRHGRTGAEAIEVDLGPATEVLGRVPYVAEIEADRYLVYEVDGEVFARSAVCPHALGPLDEGDLCEGRVRCPWHGYVFDLRDGMSCDHRALRLAPVLSTSVRAERVYLRLAL